MKATSSHVLVLGVPLAVAITGVFVFAYVAVQQNYRQSMDDPQIQMAEDIALTLSRDDTPASVVPRGVPPVDIAQSLAPWIAVYDSSGMPLESNAVLDNAPPRLPAGLFDTTTWRAHKTFAAPSGNETRVTWQPRPGVRQAVVLVQYQATRGVRYVAVGRSIRIGEERIITLTYLVAIAWSATIFASLGVASLLLFLGWL